MPILADFGGKRREKGRFGRVFCGVSARFLRPREGPDRGRRGRLRNSGLQRPKTAEMAPRGRKNTLFEPRKKRKPGGNRPLTVCSPAEKQQRGEMVFYKRGDYFGSVSLLTDAPQPATITAVGEATVLSLQRRVFKKVTANSVGVQQLLLKSGQQEGGATPNTGRNAALVSGLADVPNLFLDSEEEVGPTMLFTSLTVLSHCVVLQVDIEPPQYPEILEKVEHWLDPSLQGPGDLEHIWATLEEAWDLEFPHPAVGALENKHEALSAHLLGERGQGQVLTGRDDVVVNLDF